MWVSNSYLGTPERAINRNPRMGMSSQGESCGDVFLNPAHFTDPV